MRAGDRLGKARVSHSNDTGAMNRPINRVDFIQNYLDTVFAGDLHAKRVESLANGTLGVT